MKSKSSLYLTICFILMALLGATLGVSIASFCLSLNKNDKLLSVLSYFCLILFILILVILIFVYMQYQNHKRLEKGKNEYEEE